MPLENEGPNPFYANGSWFWYDETFALSKAYNSQRAALKALLEYARYLTIGPEPTVWERLRYELRRFRHDTRGQGKGAGQARIS